MPIAVIEAVVSARLTPASAGRSKANRPSKLGGEVSRRPCADPPLPKKITRAARAQGFGHRPGHLRGLIGSRSQHGLLDRDGLLQPRSAQAPARGNASDRSYRPCGQPLCRSEPRWLGLRPLQGLGDPVLLCEIAEEAGCSRRRRLRSPCRRSRRCAGRARELLDARRWRSAATALLLAHASPSRTRELVQLSASAGGLHGDRQLLLRPQPGECPRPAPARPGASGPR